MIDLRSDTYKKKITSGYGQREAPVAGASTNHQGLDIVLKDDNIPAVKTGVVDYVGYSSSGGNMVYIKHGDGVTARYLHLAEPSNLSVGEVVKEGQIIGIQGSTGVSSGKHLHIDFKRGGTTLNPDEYFDSGGSGAFVSTDNEGSGLVMGIVGNIIEFMVILLILVLAAVLFMKAFDIHIK